jgi:3-dehydroquinate dehydratase
MKLTSIQKPFIVAVIAESTANKCLRQLMSAEQNGADAFEINIAQLKEKELRKILISTEKPCIASNRRSDFMKLYGYENLAETNEETRVEKLLQTLENGAEVLDFELDTFTSKHESLPFGSQAETRYALKSDSKPTQFSTHPGTALRQRRLVQLIKSRGGEVLISCHTQTRIRQNEILRIVQTIELQGADLAKVVTHTFNVDDLVNFLRTVVKVKNSARIPFNLMNFGVYSIPGRLLSAAFGSAWVYCRTGSQGFAGQPTVRQARTFLDELHSSQNH